MSYLAWYMDSSLFGMRVQDVLQAVNYAFSGPTWQRIACACTGSE